MSDDIEDDDAFSRREREVLELNAAGLGYAEMAEKLGLAIGTVKRYLHRARSKHARAKYVVARFEELTGGGHD